MDDPLEIVRSICLALPETTERISHGEPSWFVRDKKLFVSYANHHHDDRVAIWCAATLPVQQGLVTARPGGFFVPPYVGHRGWLGIRLDVPLDWDEVSDLIEEAYRLVAPARLVRELDAP
jgi:hypothetical protein